jgi:histidinol phosphatase-like PHP family hydrolase
MSVHAYVHSLDFTTSEQQQLTGNMDSQSDIQTASCDHCCHFSSHTVGLHASHNIDEFVNRNRILVIYHPTYRSLTAAPPYHPPILA